MANNLAVMKDLRLPLPQPLLFIPPFEWWNDSIAAWSRQMGVLLFNFTPGMRTAADYTWPELPNYRSSQWIMNWLEQTLQKNPAQLAGAILLIHAGTDPRRTDKFYRQLPVVLRRIKEAGFRLKRIDELIQAW